MTGSDQPRTYPPGVPCWVGLGPPDPSAAARFYGELFGWAFQDAAAGRYLIATLDGRAVAGLGPASGAGAPADWMTYIAVGDAGQSAAAAAAAGGQVIEPPQDAGPGGPDRDVRRPRPGRSSGCGRPGSGRERS